MTKDVLISISGLQFNIDEVEPLKIITTGNYYFKNGKHFVLYDEILQGVDGLTKNTIKISDKKIDILKKGASNVHMIFEENKKNHTYYETPYGELMIGINTTSVNLEEKEDYMNLKINYGLDINYAHVSDCSIEVDVKDLKGAKIL